MSSSSSPATTLPIPQSSPPIPTPISYRDNTHSFYNNSPIQQNGMHTNATSPSSTTSVPIYNSTVFHSNPSPPTTNIALTPSSIQSESSIAAASFPSLDDPSSTLSDDEELLITRLHHDASIRRSRGRGSESILVYDRILSLFPNHLPTLILKGQTYRQIGDNFHATECFTRLLLIYPRCWQAHDELGSIYKDADLYDRAIASFLMAIKYSTTSILSTSTSISQPLPLSDDNQSQAKEHLAVCLTDLGTKLKLSGNVDDALHSYIEALKYCPTYSSAYFNIAVIYSEKGNFESSLKYYHMAVLHNPNYVEALCNIGVIYKNAAQLIQAIDYYERALKVNPNFVIAASNLSIALTDYGTQKKNEGKIEIGIELYKKALHYNSKYSAGWVNTNKHYLNNHQLYKCYLG